MFPIIGVWLSNTFFIRKNMFTPRNIGDDEPILTIFQIGLKPPSSFFLISIIALILSLSLSLSVFFCDVVYVRLKNFFEACTF